MGNEEVELRQLTGSSNQRRNPNQDPSSSASHDPSSSHHSNSNNNGSSSISGECRVCQKTAKFMCSRCGPKVHYCSQECQAKDWTEHRKECLVKEEEEGVDGGRDERVIEDDAMSVAESLGGRRAGAAAEVNRKGWRHLFRKRDKRQPESQPADDEEDLPQTEEERIEELKFYMNNVYLIIKPVICCVLLSILWVKLTKLETPFFGTGIDKADTGNSVFGGGISQAVGGGGTPGNPNTALFSALGIIGMIIVVTFLILCLFKYNLMKVLYGIFGIIVLALLGLFGFTLGIDLLNVYNGAMDMVTFFFFLWNLCAVGLVVIFWKGPMLLQQIYLVVMSSKMAFALSSIDPLTTWFLLGFLVVWDLIAVLCPYGPLRLLIESSKQNQREIPALLYTAAVWVGMATPPSPQHLHASSRSITETVGDRSVHHTASTADLIRREEEEEERERQAGTPAGERERLSDNARREGEEPREEGNVDEEDDEGTGLKLGLGDFVFYSVLIARAALFDWITTVAVMVAVLTGMNLTIFLLAIWHKALPALPISIAFGLLFYFVSSITLTPYYNNLMNVPDRIKILPTDSSGLWAGKLGAGLVYM
ncbi:Presenilin-1 [Phlyctochytrium planicorne]|nr:Presenilin-1 [Phlyctochytrium planicorne]